MFVYLIEFNSIKEVKELLSNFDSFFLKYYLNNYKSYFIICTSFNKFYETFRYFNKSNEIIEVKENSNYKNYEVYEDNGLFKLDILYKIKDVLLNIYNKISKTLYCERKNKTLEKKFKISRNELLFTNSKTSKKSENERYKYY